MNEKEIFNTTIAVIGRRGIHKKATILIVLILAFLLE